MWRVNSGMRYLVKGRVKSGRAGALAKAIADRTLGRGSIAGDEYWYDMQMARVNAKGEAHWVETCFCDAPLEEERPYWEKYFNLLSVKDAHLRRNCRHENGTELGRAAIAIVRNGSKRDWPKPANPSCRNSIRSSRGRRSRLSIVASR